MFPNNDALPKYREWFREAVDRNIKARSWECVLFTRLFQSSCAHHANRYDGVPGRYVDIVVGVINATSVEWAAEHLVLLSLFPRCCFTLTLDCSAAYLSKPRRIHVGCTLSKRCMISFRCW